MAEFEEGGAVVAAEPAEGDVVSGCASAHVADPLFLWACTEGDGAVVERLLDAGRVCPNSVDEEGWTPVMFACRNGHVDIVKILLLDDHCDPQACATAGFFVMFNALMLACYFGHRDIVVLLLSHRLTDPAAALMTPEGQCYSAIRFAVEFNHPAIVELLLADIRVVRALRKEDGVPPAVIRGVLSRRAMERRRIVLCAWFLYRESRYKK